MTPNGAIADNTIFDNAASVAHVVAAEAMEVLASAARLIGTDDPKLSAYFDTFTHNAIPEDIIRFSDAELAALVEYVYGKSAERKPGVPLIEIFDPNEVGFAPSQTVLIAINEDMPFLFDSCASEVRDRGFGIRAAFHPIMSRTHDDHDTKDIRQRLEKARSSWRWRQSPTGKSSMDFAMGLAGSLPMCDSR